MKTLILALLLPTLLIGCASRPPRRTAQILGSLAVVQIEKRTFPGHFHGEYSVWFSGGKVVSPGSATWYWEDPRSGGPESKPDQIPPTPVRYGMSVREVERILGEPESRHSNRYCFWVR